MIFFLLLYAGFAAITKVKFIKAEYIPAEVGVKA